MFGAIYVGLSGLTAYSNGLKQVSNNVTNLNTLGFKANSVTFTDLVTSTGTGGVSFSENENDSGGGVAIADARRDYGQGDLRQSDRELDLAISGAGFLVLLKGDEVFYTRTGSFDVDKDGFIVLAGTDYRLATLDESGRAVSVSIDSMRTSPPTPTTRIKLQGNLQADLADTDGFKLQGIKVYDNTGKEHTWAIQFQKTANVGEWTVKVTDGFAQEVGTQILKFDIDEINPDTDELVFTPAGSGWSVTLDLTTNVTSLPSPLDALNVSSVDGYKLGEDLAILVNANGELEISYSNEQKKVVGAVAIADFRDRQVLEERGAGLLVESRDGGRELMKSGELGAGRILSRRLEASNVDLAQQFGDLILIQRGFQASSQIISAANDMIQQLFGIRGQG
jgi:flagellar hook protein FlgE